MAALTLGFPLTLVMSHLARTMMGQAADSLHQLPLEVHEGGTDPGELISMPDMNKGLTTK